jgi:aminoglycoside phosphotransferase family enzyme/gluconate kinase
MSIDMNTSLIPALREALHRETGQPVELIETHLSWVLLTPVYAYKLKKPVRYPFVDFRTVRARQFACEEELRLNRRFAPGIYLDVLAVRGSPASPRLGGDGDGAVIDHAIRMKRFPQSALMRNLLMAGALKADLLDGLARRLVELRDSASMAPSPEFGQPEMIIQAVHDVLTSLQTQGSDPRLARLLSWLDAQRSALTPALTARHQDGSIRECHGDLHLENVVSIDGELVPFDCLEFDPGLRWIDVISDVAFLTMDLKAHGRSDLASRFLDVWLQGTGDHESLQVLRFYEIYRALVRALTSRLGTPIAGSAPRPDYLACAAEWASLARNDARLMITHGLSGSGKSTLASRLLQAAGAVCIRSDVERKRLFGLGPLARSAAMGLDIYTAQATRETFEGLLKRARTALQAGFPVIVDAAFLQRDWRIRFRELATELHTPFAILDCHASPDTLRHRVTARAASGLDPSEAGVEVLERQIHTRQPLEADEQALAITVPMDAPADIGGLVSKWVAARPL